jgi:DNA-directed RNA polymerase subunit H (RpoH/RPB5)
MEDSYTFYNWEESTKFDILFRAKANQVKIFQNRGYDVPEDQLESFTWDNDNYEEYIKKRDRCLRRIKRRGIKEREAFTEIYTKDKENTFVVFVEEESRTAKIKSETIKRVMAVARKKKAKRIFFVGRQPAKATALKNVAESGFEMEVYTENEMMVDRLDHVMAPVFIPLSEEEKQKFMEETSLSTARMPCFAHPNRAEPAKSEPILQNFGYPLGTVIKIYRENNYTTQITEESVYWRSVK